MTDVVVKICAFGLIGIAVLCAFALLRPLRDKRYPDDPRCWCETFGTTSTDCYCVSFGDGAE